MSLETDFFFNSTRSTSRIEALELSHPAFSRTYYLVRNPNPWMREQVLRHEDGTPITYQFCPLRLRPLASRADLDFGVSVDLGDLGEIVPAEIDRIVASADSRVRPIVKYRAWRSDRLDVPMNGPITLQVAQVTRARAGSTFDAVAPLLNLNKTGEIYSIDRFPMLASTL